ncbi:MAG: PHP domain-containing protein [Sarcina sp.]
MKKVRTDLHIHTIASDGTLTPIELLKEIENKGVKMFAITDHDSLDSINEMKELTKDNTSIKFIHGVEVSSMLEGEQLHILAYNFDLDNVNFNNLINNNKRLLQEKDDESIKMLIQRGFPLDFNEYLKYEHNPAKGGWKTLNFLIDKGLCLGVEDFFSRVFTDDRKLQYPNFPHPKEIIMEIKKAGGIAIMAHPSYGKSSFTLEYILDEFKAWGIDGIECSHPHHSVNIKKYLESYCIKNNLIITGGSDYHGGLLSKRSLGIPEFYASLDIFDKR